MMQNNETTTGLDKGVYIIHGEEDLKTTELSPNFDSDTIKIERNVKQINTCCATVTPIFIHYFSLIVQGLLIWGILWCAWGDGWKWDGQWFRLAIVSIIAWGSGQILQSVTTLPPLLAALLTGILARHLDYLDMREFPEIDIFLRKIYPVIILGKSSLAWDLKFMRSNLQQVVTLGVAPWTAEVVTVAICTNVFLNYPWVWGFLLGSIYASLSCAVVMPTVLRIGASPNRTRNWPQLVCTAGGADTALSVGVYGIIYSFIFSEVDEGYRYTKVALTLFAGIALGVAWGSLAKLLPHARDPYLTELRVLSVLVGGLFINFFTLHLGWGGAGGVAVLACNATAAQHWARTGWKLNNNPASTAYRVIWSALEPTVFAYTGTFFVLKGPISETLIIGFGILFIGSAVRLVVAALMCWKMTLKEKLFVCCTWVPKSIVEAVLCPLAISTLILKGKQNAPEMEHAEKLMTLVVQAILITTPIGFVLTKLSVPMMVRDNQKDLQNDSEA